MAKTHCVPGSANGQSDADAPTEKIITMRVKATRKADLRSMVPPEVALELVHKPILAYMLLGTRAVTRGARRRAVVSKLAQML
jgi:hypothetical protein